MTIETFDETHIAKAFKNPSQLTIADCAEMQRRIKAEQLSWRRRGIAQERLGYSSQEAERQKKYYKPKNPKWMRRKLTDTDREILTQAWQ
ncbi:hypothetical protein [Paracoccus lutimaris]|uniref:hypothetical protein n=1 Tax=Paracoccus lutimaris TaxID=1490030 RepID=UPI0011C065AA|nr:hypothetical protein [Paracoccus lutimaris]